MKRFLPPTGGSSDTSTGNKTTCGEPTCKHKSQLLTAIHKCPCGRPMHAFCGRGIGDEGYGQQRMCTDCQKKTDEGGIGTSSSPMEYKTEMVTRLADLIDDWDTVRARNIRRGCRGLSDAGQATMLDVTEILSEKWSRLSAQTVIRCWLKADILPREHCNLLKSMDTRLDREDKDEQGFIDDLCDLVKKMSMPTSVARSANPRCMPRVLTDNLCVEQGAGLSEQDLRQAIQTWLTVEDDP
ncbi:unnamed protein product, partial [Ectocarpus sp. 12 AP-2014]